MMKYDNFQQVHQALAAYVPNAKSVGSYTLDRILSLMDFLGNPQNELKVVHVAGTSGKTSTSYYAASLLKSAGYTVGLTVSPHVAEVNERLQINLVPMPEKEFCREFGEFQQLVITSGINPSYFEFLIAFAFWEFAKCKVDYAVIEVGLGGLLDGTNVVNRSDKVCIITDIGLDHINILGNTLTEIAYQKAGIIQPDNIVFCHKQAPKIMSVFKERADQQHARLCLAENKLIYNSLNFLPLFQQRNFSLAKVAVDYILERDHRVTLELQQIEEAAKILVPARMEERRVGKKTIIFDGAHNEQKLTALGESIEAKYPGQPVAALISFVSGRSFRLDSSLAVLAKITNTLIITAFQQASQDLPHGPVDPKELAVLARTHGFKHITIESDPKQAYKKLLARSEPILLVTGSFYLMEDLRPEV